MMKAFFGPCAEQEWSRCTSLGETLDGRPKCTMRLPVSQVAGGVPLSSFDAIIARARRRMQVDTGSQAILRDLIPERVARDEAGGKMTRYRAEAVNTEDTFVVLVLEFEPAEAEVES